MKKLTNHMLGPRGVNTNSGTVWIEPGQTVEIDPKEIVGELPELGKASDASKADDDNADMIALLEAEIADLKKAGEAQTKEVADLKKSVAEKDKEIADLKKAAKP